MTGEPHVPRQFTVLGPLPQYGPVMSDRTWPSGDSSGQWLESRVRHLSSADSDDFADEQATQIVRIGGAS